MTGRPKTSRWIIDLTFPFCVVSSEDLGLSEEEANEDTVRALVLADPDEFFDLAEVDVRVTKERSW